MDTTLVGMGSAVVAADTVVAAGHGSLLVWVGTAPVDTGWLEADTDLILAPDTDLAVSTDPAVEDTALEGAVCSLVQGPTLS